MFHLGVLAARLLGTVEEDIQGQLITEEGDALITEDGDRQEAEG